jgi:hypothetical protein
MQQTLESPAINQEASILELAERLSDSRYSFHDDHDDETRNDFYADLKILEAKYPMVHFMVTTPETFVRRITGDRGADWSHPLWPQVARELSDVLDDELDDYDGSADLEDFIKAAIKTAIQNLSEADMETIKLDEMPSGCAVRFADGSIGDFLSNASGRKVRVRIGNEVETRGYDELKEGFVDGKWCTIQLPNLVLLTERDAANGE